MKLGDIVVRRSYNKDIAFTIIDIQNKGDKTLYILKGVNLRIVADAPASDLQQVLDYRLGKYEPVFNKKVNESIKNIVSSRSLDPSIKKKYKNKKRIKIKGVPSNYDGMSFKRPGRILHIDGDSSYLEVCLKVYKQLLIEAVGMVIPESEQPNKIVDVVKEIKPDIVVITGHDSMSKNVVDYTNLDNYRNSKYFVDSVTKLREYEANYDNLVIYAGACQSCYEAIMDAGAN